MSEPLNPLPLTPIVRVPRLEPSEIPEMVEFARLALVIPAEPLRLLLVSPVIPEPEPVKMVAPRLPVEELKVRLEPDLGARFPVAAVVKSGKQVVSDDSSATVTLVETPAVSA